MAFAAPNQFPVGTKLRQLGFAGTTEGEVHLQQVIGGNGTTAAATGDGGAAVLTSVGVATITTSGLTITGGRVVGVDDGGGIRNHRGILTITDSVITDNSAAGDNGGGLFSHNGTLTITGSTFSGNSAYEGGGLYVRRGTTNLSEIVVDGNSFSHINASGSMSDFEADELNDRVKRLYGDYISHADRYNKLLKLQIM